MAATTVTTGYKTTPTSFPLSLPNPPPSQKIFTSSNELIHCNYRITLPPKSLKPCFVSPPETSVVVDEEPAEESETPPDDEFSSNSGSFTGCRGCGREETERGCNGEGRIQGGIATVPGFGWWPIKAYRPCPAYVASGGRYRRTGQSMDEVVSGKGVRDGGQSRTKK